MHPQQSAACMFVLTRPPFPPSPTVPSQKGSSSGPSYTYTPPGESVRLRTSTMGPLDRCQRRARVALSARARARSVAPLRISLRGGCGGAERVQHTPTNSAALVDGHTPHHTITAIAQQQATACQTQALALAAAAAATTRSARWTRPRTASSRAARPRSSRC